MNPLLVIFNPRSIPEFYKAIERINGISKLWIKYFPQDEAYNKAREFFLQSDYTHFMILPDDLIVTQADVDAIVNHDESYDSISGWCNNPAVMIQISILTSRLSCLQIRPALQHMKATVGLR
jgi:hypothetical protein